MKSKIRCEGQPPPAADLVRHMNMLSRQVLSA
jgi:hypothetical protein